MMDKIKKLEDQIKKFEDRIEKLERLGMEEKEFIGFFQQVESCSCFEELEDLAKQFNKMRIPKVETFMLALALRIRQNTIVTEALDEELAKVKALLTPGSDKWQ